MKKVSVKSIGLLSLLFSSNLVFAQADIHFTEYRVLLTEKKTKVDYQVFNQGNSDAACSTSIVDYTVDKNGQIKLVTEGKGPETSAKDAKLVRISPKRFKVEANSNQKLKVIARQLRRQSDGEWVSYLSITCKEDKPSLQSGVNIVPNFKYHIPIVVRKGKLSADIEVSDLALLNQDGKPVVKATLKRTGNRSVYGDFIIKDVNTGDILARQNGISHYLQAEAMTFDFGLNKASTGPIEVSFVENKTYGGNLVTSSNLSN